MKDNTSPTSKQVPVKPYPREVWLTLDSIFACFDTQPRIEIDWALVDEYAELYRAGVKMPPIIVFESYAKSKTPERWIADGFHRYHAARKAGKTKILCELRLGNLADAQWFSYAANQTHGLRRTNADKAKAVKAALQHPCGAKMSNPQIAEYIGVSEKTVAKYRAELESTSDIPTLPTRIGKDGKKRKAKQNKPKPPAPPEPAPPPEPVADDEPDHEPVPAADHGAAAADQVVGDAFDYDDEIQFLVSWNRARMDEWPTEYRKAMSQVYQQLAQESLICADDDPPASPVTCPNCGGHEVDEDGDCKACLHQKIAPPSDGAPIKTAIIGTIKYEVEKRGMQWFYRVDEAAGWTCAGAEMAKLIEDAGVVRAEGAADAQ